MTTTREPPQTLPLQEKMEDYLDNGARLGWLLDAAGRRVFVYRPEKDVETLEAPASVSADPELPGLALDLALISEADF